MSTFNAFSYVCDSVQSKPFDSWKIRPGICCGAQNSSSALTMLSCWDDGTRRWRSRLRSSFWRNETNESIATFWQLFKNYKRINYAEKTDTNNTPPVVRQRSKKNADRRDSLRINMSVTRLVTPFAIQTCDLALAVAKIIERDLLARRETARYCLTSI